MADKNMISGKTENANNGITSIEFFSLHYHYLIAAAIIILYSFFTWRYFGLTIDEIMERGTFFALGAFSPFYYLAVPPLLTAVIILLYSIISARKVTLSASDDTFTVKEKSIVTLDRAIKRNKIQIVSYKTGYPGAKYLWVIILGIHMSLVFMDGLSLLTNPSTFDLGIPQALYYTAGGFVDLAAMLVIILPGEHCLEFRTRKDLYKMRFFPVNNQLSISVYLSQTLTGEETEQINLFNRRPEHEVAKKHDMSSAWETLNQHFTIITGGIFIVLGIVSFALKFYMGSMLCIVSVLLGILIVLEELKDLPLTKNQKDSTLVKRIIGNGEQSDEFKTEIRKEAAFGISNLWTDVGDPRSKIEPQFRKPNAFTPVLWMLFTFLSGWTISAWFRFLPSTSVSIWFSIVEVLFFLFTMILITGVILGRSKTIQLEKDGDTFSLPLEKTDSKLFIRGLEGKDKKNRIEVTLRILSVVLPLIAGIVTGLM